MRRPELVGDAIQKDDNGISFGAYGSFRVHTAYQPIFDLAAGGPHCHGFEGLVRPFKNREAFSPGQFFDSIVEADRFFIEALCRALHLRNAFSLQHDCPRIFINFDPATYVDMASASFEVSVMLEKMEALGLGPDNMVCEIIETPEQSKETLVELTSKLRNCGIKIAVDDFGAVSSNIERVRLLSPDYIKLDRLWFRELIATMASRKLLQSIVSEFFHSSIHVIFEGIETLAEYEFARECGGTLFQGFLMGKPKLAGSITHDNALNALPPSLAGDTTVRKCVWNQENATRL